MSKDNKKEEALKKLIGDKSNIRQEYGSYMSHYHCWHQNQYPACGIPLENHKQYHKQCCLCDTPYSTKEKCEIVNDLEFDRKKEAYCPKCYFEDNKQILRSECPHSTSTYKGDIIRCGCGEILKEGWEEVVDKDRKVKAHYNLLRSKERLYAIEREMLE